MKALVDLVPHAAGELRAHPGGGPYNTARTLGRLEQDVHYLGCISDDGFGKRLRAELEADGVRLDATLETRLPTTLALAEVDDSGAATYRFYTDGTSAPSLDPEAALAALPALGCGVIHRPYAHDPILRERRGVSGDPGGARTSVLATHNEPTPPQPPVLTPPLPEGWLVTEPIRTD